MHMKYISGIHALNLTCDLLTCGDWHQSAIQWKRPQMRDSTCSVFGDWGIESNKAIPEHTELFYSANHIRALLDLIDEGNFAIAQGMKDDFICNDDYNDLVFEKVWLLKDSTQWEKIDAFMSREYRLYWVRFKKERGHE